MFTFLPRLHIRIATDLLTVRNLHTGETLSEVPEVAFVGTPRKMLAAGTQARVAAARALVGDKAEVVNPFAHPRSLVSDFVTGEALLRFFIRRMLGRPLLQASPLVFLRPVGMDEGGYTPVERRALHEMALGAGASRVVLCIPSAPTDEEMLKMKVGLRRVGD